MRKNSYPQQGYRYSRLAISGAKLMEKFFPRPPLGKGVLEDESPTILFIELFGLGDVASLSVTFDPLLRRFPKAKIHILCQPAWASFYANDFRVFKVDEMRTPWKSSFAQLTSWSAWASVMQTLRRMQKIKFDWCIETRGDIRSQIVARWIQPKRLVGPLDYMGSNMILRGDLLSDRIGSLPIQHRYERNCDCLTPILGEAAKISIPSLLRNAKKVPLGGLPRLLIHPAGGWKYKHWPEKRWRLLLIDLLKKKDWEVGLLCAPGEEGCIERISGGISVRVETPPLVELLSTIQSYDAMVATDSGPINLAILSGMPVVDIMGPGDSTLWGPFLGRGVLLQNVSNYPCHPCLQRKCFFPSNPCIQQIHGEDVKNALERVREQIGERPPH